MLFSLKLNPPGMYLIYIFISESLNMLLDKGYYHIKSNQIKSNRLVIRIRNGWIFYTYSESREVDFPNRILRTFGVGIASAGNFPRL